MKTAPFTIFNKTREIKIITYTDGKLDSIPKDVWDDTWWIERDEDMYGLMSPQAKNKTIRIVLRSDWIDAGFEELLR